jgi:hypothetical protein
MVVFGGNWSIDCRVLHGRLHESPVREYVDAHFEIVNVNIGEMNVNLGIARDLCVSLEKGVPAVAFFSPNGSRSESPVRVSCNPLASTMHNRS